MRIRVEGDPLNADVTPDHRRAYVTLGALNGVASVDLDTMKVLARGETGQGPDGIAYAPAPAARTAARAGQERGNDEGGTMKAERKAGIQESGVRGQKERRRPVLILTSGF